MLEKDNKDGESDEGVEETVAEISEEMERVERSIDEFFSRTLYGVEDTLLDDIPSMSLRPLFRVEVSEREVRVVMDLPRVEKRDLVVSSTEDVLSVDAKLSKPVRLRVGGNASKSHAQFERYSKEIALPVKVSPTKARARFSNGILVVKLPRVHSGRAIKIA